MTQIFIVLKKKTKNIEALCFRRCIQYLAFTWLDIFTCITQIFLSNIQVKSTLQ